jgi:hypothetical protein
MLLTEIEDQVEILAAEALDPFEIEDFNVTFTGVDAPVLIEFRDTDVSSQMLQALSEAFKTKNINFGTEERDDGYCETCSAPYTATVIRIEDWKLPRHDLAIT